MLKGEKQKAINYLNVAIELDSSIYKEIETQSIFLPIIKSIKAPNLNNTLNIPISKLTKKENQTIKHLKDTYYLVNKLNNNDIKMKRNIKNNSKDKNNVRERDEK